MKTAVFTIASRNYFAYVKTLMDSLERSNPQWERYVVLVDELSDDFAKIPGNFEFLPMDALGLPEQDKMIFRYTIMELNTAVKPFAIERLFLDYGFDRVIYLDPDIYVYERMQEVEDALDRGCNFVLTPHFTGIWEEDGKMPDEPAIMRSGVYNLGFLALGKAPTTLEMVRWWQQRLETQCIVDMENGLFVDQKWMDLVPGRYSDVCILRHEGYNVAYWNLEHRKVSVSENRFFFNGQPLVFFHFSGLNPNDLTCLSKHQDRFYWNNIGPVRELVEGYAKTVLAHDYDSWKRFQYAYGVFKDGRYINDLFRYAYRNDKALQQVCGDNPYDQAAVFYETHKLQVVLFLAGYLWKFWPDLQVAFMQGMEPEDYFSWIKEYCIVEYRFPKDYFAGMRVKDIMKVMPASSSKWKMMVYKVLPPVMWNFTKKMYKKSKTFLADKKLLPHAEDQNRLLEDGVNLIGYIRSEHGVGEACRMTAECLNTMDLNWSIYDYELNNPSRQEDHTWDDAISGQIKYNISIFNINADQMEAAHQNTPKSAWKGYKIGIWYWELTEFPDEWCRAFELVDEIWAPTKFIMDSLKKKASCPVVYMPPGIARRPLNPAYDRNYFGLPEHAFLFLNMFDSFSYASRKNPRAAIEAFKQAFGGDDTTVGLVIKLNNADEAAVAEIRAFTEGHRNIYVLARTFDRDEINALIASCDAAVSLHRSEGLGLLCEEAMYFGKAVIATNWSGNTDFMTEDTACLVDCRLEDIGQDIGPYKAWQKWAVPDIGQAAGYMKRLKDDSEYYAGICKNAKAHIRENFSPEVCGKRMYERICEIKANVMHR